MNLTKGWHTWWRQWSTWLCGAGISVIYFTPDLHVILLEMWQDMPLEIKQTIPESWVRYFGLLLAAISIPAKYVRQKKLHESVNNVS